MDPTHQNNEGNEPPVGHTWSYSCSMFVEYLTHHCAVEGDGAEGVENRVSYHRCKDYLCLVWACKGPDVF